MKNNICIDLGGTNIKAGIIQNQKLLHSCNAESNSDSSFSAVMKTLQELILKMVSDTNLTLKDIGGIGLCMPGIIDVDNNKVIAINAKHAEAIHFDFNAWAKEAFKLPVVMENDARAALAGEWQNGAGKGYNDIVMMTIGTGIGGAALINGKLLHGKHYQAGCLGGHFTINYAGTDCNCGNLGCVESEASSWRLESIIKAEAGGEAFLQKMGGVIDYRLLFEQKRAGNAIATKVVEHNLRAWSAGIVNLIHAYDPEIVILSGGVMKSKEDIMPFFNNWVQKHAWTPSHNVNVIASSETDNIALWGMNYLVNKKLEKGEMQ